VGRYGTTLGKRAMNMRVVDESGRDVAYWQAVIRYFGEILGTLLLGLGYAMAIIDPERRTLHDHLAGTKVLMDSSGTNHK